MPEVGLFGGGFKLLVHPGYLEFVIVLLRFELLLYLFATQGLVEGALPTVLDPGLVHGVVVAWAILVVAARGLRVS